MRQLRMFIAFQHRFIGLLQPLAGERTGRH